MSDILKAIIKEEVRKTLNLLTEGIVHIDKLKPQDLLNFLKGWNLDKAKFHVSEKMDGNYMALGVDNGQFYLRSKSRSFGAADEVPKIFFMNDFRKYFGLLESIPWNDIFAKMAAKWGFDFDGTFEIEGEAIPSFDHNIVIYDEAKIGDGIFLIFNTKASVGKDKSGRVHNPEMWLDLAEEINKHSSVKFFSVPEVSLGDLEFDNKIIVDLEALIEEHGNFLKKPARTQAAKELKAKLLATVAELGKQAKGQALGVDVASKFGPEVEGVVISGPDGKLVKIVDTAKFTARKETNWHFINQLISAERDFKKSIKENPQDLEMHLLTWKEEVEDVQKDFDENGHEYITINKKFEDTQNGIDFALGMVKVMKGRLDAGESYESIVDDFKNRKIIPEGAKLREAVALTEEDLQEGGSVFDDMNSVVPKALLEPSIERALVLANLDGLPFEVVGNKSKPFFNDIDIAIDVRDLLKFLKLPEGEQGFWDELNNHLSRSHVDKYSIIKGLKQFHILVPLIDSSGEQVNAFLPDGSRGDVPAMIQLDVFVGNLDWMKDINSGAPESSKYKAAWRNMLLASIASVVQWNIDGDEDDEYHRYVMNFRDGLKRQKIKVIPPSGRRKKPKKEKLSDEVITSSPNDMAEILFGKGAKWSDMNSFEELHKLLTGPKFQFKKFLPEILSNFKESLVKRKMAVPTELAD